MVVVPRERTADVLVRHRIDDDQHKDVGGYTASAEVHHVEKDLVATKERVARVRKRETQLKNCFDAKSLMLMAA